MKVVQQLSPYIGLHQNTRLFSMGNMDTQKYGQCDIKEDGVEFSLHTKRANWRQIKCITLWLEEDIVESNAYVQDEHRD